MLITATHLNKRYLPTPGAEPVNVLRDLDLQIAAGETVAITGPSGSGKSTLLNILGGLDTADGGEVTVAGQRLDQLAPDALAAYRNRTVGFVFQLHHLLPQCTVLENVLIPTLASGTAAEATPRAKELLAAVGLQDRLDHRPAQLSGGERQRAAVARALINQPQVLLADEPTGALDRANATKLADLLAELNQQRGITIVLVTHAPELARRMKRVVELVDGQLVGRSAV